MVDVVRFVNSRFTSNTYVIYNTESEEAWIVDPGDFAPVEEWLESNGITSIKGILFTHGHFDHIYGANDILEKFPNVIFYSINEIGVTIPFDAKKNGSKYTESPFVLSPLATIKEINHVTELWHGIHVECIFTPGHSEDSMCILLGNILFTGDTLIKNVRTVTKLKGGSVEKLQDSISIIETLMGRELIIYPGHGDIFPLDGYNLEAAIRKL